MYRKCLYEGKPLAYVENVWDFKNEREKEKTFDISFVDSYTLNKEKMDMANSLSFTLTVLIV